MPNTSLVWGEVSYAYKPVIGYVLTGTLNLKDQIYHAAAAVRHDHAHRVVIGCPLTGSAATSST